MGLFSNFKNIGGILKDSVLSGIGKGIRQTQLSSQIPINNDGSDSQDYYQDIKIDDAGDFTLYDNTITNIDNNGVSYDRLYVDKFPNTSQTPLEKSNYKKLYNTDQDSENYKLSIPQWGYEDFINERNIFIKHLSNGFDEPGWFYFKIFFDFSTNHGLFGGILSNKYKEKFISVNSATDYLLQCQELFNYEKLNDRIVCLCRFTKMLSYININAPWFFKSIKNLGQSSQIKLSDNLTEKKSIEIELDQDAIDMRISTLLSLYKYACYDTINDKEILPENLRKFDMCILVFSAPIKFLHNVVSNNGLKKLYNNTTASNNIMSFKLYKLLNCEIDVESLSGYIPDDMNNEQPFNLGKNTLKINFDRIYEYTMNEYIGLMFGNDGIYLDSPTIKTDDIQNLTILSESKIHDNINKLLKGNSHYILGNIFGQDKQIYEKNVSDSIISKIFTNYAKSKYGIMANNKNLIVNLGYDILYKLLGTGYNANAEVLKVGKQVIGDGTVLNGHGDYKVGTWVWKAKMRRMLTGKTDLSDRELRLTTVGTALHTNWAQNLYNRALNSI